MKKSTTKKPHFGHQKQLIVVIVVLVGLLVWIGLLSVKVHSTQKQLSEFKDSQELQNTLLGIEVDSQKVYEKPVVSLRENVVVLPEVRISLPYNSVTRNIQYQFDDGEKGDGDTVSVTHALISDHTKQRQLSCSQLLRLSTISGAPYNPWEEAAGSVQLDDGRTLYIIAAKAFANNEASTTDCADEVWWPLPPMQLAKEFLNAKSYNL